MKKFVLLSHVLPPSWSGQAVILHRLLQPFDPEDYILISSKDYSEPSGDYQASTKLPAPYFYMRACDLLSFPHAILKKLPTRIQRFLNRMLRFGDRVWKKLPLWMNIAYEIYCRSRQLEQLIRKNPAHVIIVCTGDFYDLPAGYLAARRMGIPFIPYIFDDYAYQWTGSLRWFSIRFERFMLRRTPTIIVTNEHTAKEYEQRYGVTSEIIHNLCPIPELDNLSDKRSFFEPDTFNIVYTGAIYHAHFDAFRNLIQAIEQLSHHNIRLHLFTAQSPAFLADEGIKGRFVIQHNHIPNHEIPAILFQADILFLPLAFNSTINPVLKTASPGKMGEYLSMQRPILVHAPSDSFVSTYFKTHNCGIVVDEDNPSRLAEAIDRLITQPELQNLVSQNARQRAINDFSMTKVQSKFSTFTDTFYNKKSEYSK